MAVIVIPKILSQSLTEEGAKAFVKIIDKIRGKSSKNYSSDAEERFGSKQGR
jgi:hypothetical protein